MQTNEDHNVNPFIISFPLLTFLYRRRKREKKMAISTIILCFCSLSAKFESTKYSLKIQIFLHNNNKKANLIFFCFLSFVHWFFICFIQFYSSMRLHTYAHCAFVFFAVVDCLLLLFFYVKQELFK